jgi:hypothetical protein
MAARTPIQKWRELEKDNKLLSKEITGYLALYHEGVQLNVYAHRWRKYIEQKKQPHYDTIKYHYLYHEFLDDPERKRQKQVKAIKDKQCVKVQQELEEKYNNLIAYAKSQGYTIC